MLNREPLALKMDQSGELKLHCCCGRCCCRRRRIHSRAHPSPEGAQTATTNQRSPRAEGGRDFTARYKYSVAYFFFLVLYEFLGHH